MTAAHPIRPAGDGRAQRGLTLIELAVVLVIVGLVLSATVTASNAVTNSARTRETRDRMAAIEDALVVYAGNNNLLPCPADPAAETGIQRGGDTGSCATNADRIGIVPWETLGITRSDATDAWGRYITYAVSDTLADPTAAAATWGALPEPIPDPGLPFLCDGSDSQIEALYASVVGNLDVRGTADVTPPDFGLGAYVLVSHGINGFGARVPGGATIPTPAGFAGSAEAFNTSAADQWYYAAPPGGGSDPTVFDDTVTFRTAAQILMEADCIIDRGSGS